MICQKRNNLEKVKLRGTIGEHEVLCLDEHGAERVSDAVPFPRFAHWGSAAITGRLKTAVLLAPTPELERRKAILETATR